MRMNAFLHRFRVLKMRGEDKCGLWIFTIFLGVLYMKNVHHF